MQTFYLKVIAADHTFFQGRCRSLVIPAIDGEKGILPHHEDMIIAVNEGEIRIEDEQGEKHAGIVGAGFVQIINNRVTLLVETAERPEDIDVKRAREAKERAMERLRQKQSIQEFHLSQASLARAMSRLKAAGRYHS